MVFEKSSGRGAGDELARLWYRIRQIYDEQRTSCRLTHLQMSMLCSPDKPHAEWVSLRASGAEVRHLVPVLAQLAFEECSGSDVSKNRVLALQSLTAFYQICDRQPMFMTDEAADAALQTMESFLAYYTWLSNVASILGKYYYQVVPKVHFCWHLAFDCKFMNARHKWAYKCESWVGKVSAICHSCSSGTRLTKVTVPLAEKHRLYVHVRLIRCVFED